MKIAYEALRWIRSGWAICALFLLGIGCDPPSQTLVASNPPAQHSGIWISRDEILELPMKGPAWDGVVEAARQRVVHPSLSNQDDRNSFRVLAKALYFARTGDADYAAEVRQALDEIRGTEKNATALAISRELIAYVVAADLVGLDDDERAGFERWLRRVTKRRYKGRSIRSTHEDRPNNWGTHAGATRIAVAAYLGDRREIERAAHVFHGWTGEEQGWRRFQFEESWWQSDARRPYAVNPRDAWIRGHPVGGVLPDDQRRGGRFRWPPPKENYVYEALQGAIAQAVLLDRLGYDVWNWGDRALLRAFEWLYGEANFPAEGDDTWLPPIVNQAYGSNFFAPVPSRPGKGMGFADWTHVRSRPSRNADESSQR